MKSTNMEGSVQQLKQLIAQNLQKKFLSLKNEAILILLYNQAMRPNDRF